MIPERKLPQVCKRTKKEIIDILLKEEYGYLPLAPLSVEARVIEKNERFAAGKAHLSKLAFTIKAEFGEYTFPVYYACPTSEGKHPAFIHINFRDKIPDDYQPTEEIIDSGYALLTFCYQDVSSDNGDFENGLAGVVYKNGKREKDQCGKIGLWAYAAMAILTYARTLPELDGDRISVIGHSRLGKTALLAGMLDERFYCAFSNNSGCSGASLLRENTGETVEAIYNRFPFWFCENFEKYKNNEDALPFDQHFLVAANYPHYVYVASAKGDEWACPTNEFLSCIYASEYYKENGKTGFVKGDDMPRIAELFHEGDIGYHIRSGLHYLSREDWGYYMKFLDDKISKDKK